MPQEPTGLRRDLGTLESYAALIGILVGAGIFQVTRDLAGITGPSAILGYVVMAPVILCSAVPYMAFLSTPLGREPGGEYTHVRHTFGDDRLAFVGAWLKIVSYVGAGAYLAGALANYGLELAQVEDPLRARLQLPVALAGLALFLWIHVSGVRWFGRIQVGMCALLGVAILVLVIPGLFAIERAHFAPFFREGRGGFLVALTPLLFSFAGFESLAQTAGEVEDSTERLPGIFLRGILWTTVLFIAMTVVAFGVLPSEQLAASDAPMSTVAAQYLPFGATALVTLGAIMAVATSLNATILVPARLTWMLGREQLVPRALGTVHANSGTPRLALFATAGTMALLLISGQVGLCLNIAVVALLLLYVLHSFAHLCVRHTNPDLASQMRLRLPVPAQIAAALISILGLGAVVWYQLRSDAQRVWGTNWLDRAQNGDLTSLELLIAWSAIGLVVYARRSRREVD